MEPNQPEAFLQMKDNQTDTNNHKTNNSEQNNDFMSNLSREEIVENRKIRRKLKRDAFRLEKQKQREQKLLGDRLGQSRSDKVKVVHEEEVRNFRRNQMIDRPDYKTVSTDEKEPVESFDLSNENFPKLCDDCDSSYNIVEENVSIEAHSSSSKTYKRASNKLLNTLDPNTKGFRINEKDFPNLERTETVLNKSTNTYTNIDKSNIACTNVENRYKSIEISSIKDTSDAKDNSALDITNCLPSAQEHTFGNTIKGNANENTKSHPVKAELSGTSKNTTHENSRRWDNSRISKMPYSINLLQIAKIHQRKYERRNKAKKTAQKPDSQQVVGNLLDSSRPLKMNKGKHYWRNNVARRNKKRTTRRKNIIRNYRKLKHETSFREDQVPNVFLNKEFLESLQHHICRDLYFNSDSEKRIFIFNFFTNKKNRNKVWDKMRACIRSMDRTKEMDNIKEMDNTKEMDNFKEMDNIKEMDNTKEMYNTKEMDNIKEIDNIIDNVAEKEAIQAECDFKSLVNENSTTKLDDWTKPVFRKDRANTIQNRNVEELTIDLVNQMDERTNEKGNILENCQANHCNPKNIMTSDNNTSESNLTKLNERISIDAEIPPIPDDNIGKTSGFKKQKCLEKKAKMKLVLNSAENDAIQPDDRLDLLDIVDVITKEHDIEQLHSAKLQIHSRSFRPYCNQMPSPALRKVSIDLIKQIVSFQERLFKSDPIKARTHRRYIVGINEIKKNLPVKNKVKMLFIAPDLECVPVAGGIEDDVQNLLAMATVQGVPYLFSVPRRKLGYLTFKSSLISCLAVLDYSGCETSVEQILPLISQARLDYEDRLRDILNSLRTNIELTTC